MIRESYVASFICSNFRVSEKELYYASVAKLGKNENVTTDVLVKICTALKCDISDIMEIIEVEGEKA